MRDYKAAGTRTRSSQPIGMRIDRRLLRPAIVVAAGVLILALTLWLVLGSGDRDVVDAAQTASPHGSRAIPLALPPAPPE
jgi:hypothetical protein